MNRSNVFRDGNIHVLRAMCPTCIFRPGNLMDLEPGRVDGMVEEATANEGCIPCHSTLNNKNQSVCRGFFDNHPTAPLQIADRLGFVVFDELPGRSEGLDGDSV